MKSFFCILFDEYWFIVLVCFYSEFGRKFICGVLEVNILSEYFGFCLFEEGGMVEVF